MTTAVVAPPASRLTPRRGRSAFRRNLAGWLFLSPAVILIAAFTLAPFAQAILLSFQEWDGISPDTPFVGLENYQRVFEDEIFWASMRNVLVFAAIGFVGGVGIALAMAIAVNKSTRGRAFFRTAFYLPGVFSVVVVGLMFSWIFNPSVGILNRILEVAGLSELEQNWLGDPAWALPSVAAVFVWYHWGFAFLLFLAGLQDIPAELYEAASLDGARAWARFRFITWPQLAPVTAIVTLLTIVGAMQIFGTVQVLTNGGPGYNTMVPTLLIYSEAFTNHRYGTAAAMSVIFGGALVVLAALQLWYTARKARA
ncbi:ABC transporter permease subunit (plasmid) [Rathayibacter sp. VKM Ac-2803]|uniref:Sugar ABC transporter permease n=1 Tax=Rathayibacter caricis DSM 15933 TaxID=1328867 RepID=A0A2T4UNR1_9MICO|nr:MULTISPECIES: sugar ABC transporter permease [Rathayibacter]MWV51564.1 ABC transporter permease subunit [Rathayibacter sp. VKM Ac-2803]PTL71165.1 sugar ABC transporter permease [Rathayibacter caricis DSM 15933]